MPISVERYLPPESEPHEIAQRPHLHVVENIPAPDHMGVMPGWRNALFAGVMAIVCGIVWGCIVEYITHSVIGCCAVAFVVAWGMFLMLWPERE